MAAKINPKGMAPAEVSRQASEAWLSLDFVDGALQLLGWFVVSREQHELLRMKATDDPALKARLREVWEETGGVTEVDIRAVSAVVRMAQVEAGRASQFATLIEGSRLGHVPHQAVADADGGGG
ncbi:MAG: hypothetical protein H6934_06385 [Burkholderiaceae bacterium]|nr:hypothetical protein [Burkholderiaceae bacterium]